MTKLTQIILFRTGNDGLGDKRSRETGYKSDDKGRTIQSGKDDADINILIKRFGVGATQTKKEPMFGDFVGLPGEYQESLNQVIDTQARFNALPSAVRKRFRNDPNELISFVADADNADEAVKLGLLPKPEPKTQAAPDPPKPETPVQPPKA